MKKCYVLLGLLLAVAFLLPQGVFAEDSHWENATHANSTENVTIMANTLARIELNETGNVTENGWDLAIGLDNEVTGVTLGVRSNIMYELKVEDLMDPGKSEPGHMMNWTSGTYDDTTYLSHPLKIETSPPDTFADLGVSALTLLGEQPATTNGGVLHPVKMQQVVDYGDRVLGGTSMYRIVLKFTAGNT